MQANSFTSSFKSIGKVLLFFGIIIIVLNFSGQKYLEAASQNKINAFTKQRFDEFYAQEQDTIDMVFIGSSHSYCTFDPEIIDEALGTNSWQLGTPNQHPDTTYHVLKEVLNYQSPKTVVMELYWDTLDDKFELKQADSFFEVLQNDELKQEFIRKGFPLGEQVKYRIPAIKYQQDYFSYKGKEIEKSLEEKYGVYQPWTAPANGVEYYVSKGYVYCDIILDDDEYDKTNQFKGLDGGKWEMDSTQKSYVEKIIKLCADNGIELIFVTAPIAPVSMEFIQNYDKIHEKVKALAADNGIAYLDYNLVNLKEDILQNENFRDDAHLNHSGVEIVDAHFINWISAGLNEFD